MIGQLLKDGKVVATLTEKAVWEGDDEVIVTRLNLLYDPKKATGAAALLPYGIGVIEKAGADMGLEVKLYKKIEPLPPDVVS